MRDGRELLLGLRSVLLLMWVCAAGGKERERRWRERKRWIRRRKRREGVGEGGDA